MRLWFENKCTSCGKKFGNNSELIFIGGTGKFTVKPNHTLVFNDGQGSVQNPIEYDGEVLPYCKDCWGE